MNEDDSEARSAIATGQKHRNLSFFEFASFRVLHIGDRVQPLPCSPVELAELKRLATTYVHDLTSRLVQQVPDGRQAPGGITKAAGAASGAGPMASALPARQQRPNRRGAVPASKAPTEPHPHARLPKALDNQMQRDHVPLCQLHATALARPHRSGKAIEVGSKPSSAALG